MGNFLVMIIILVFILQEQLNHYQLLYMTINLAPIIIFLHKSVFIFIFIFNGLDSGDNLESSRVKRNICLNKIILTFH